MQEIKRVCYYPIEKIDKKSLEFTGIGFKFEEKDSMWEDVMDNVYKKIKKERKLLGILSTGEDIREEIEPSTVTHHITDVNYNSKTKEIIVQGKILQNSNTSKILEYVESNKVLYIEPRIFVSRIIEENDFQYFRISKIYSFDIHID